MSNLVDTSNFVEPYFIEELGEVGLSATDIAKSLVAEAKSVRRKLREGFLERIKAQGFQGVLVSTPNKTNGLDFEEIYLDVSAAKFFVGKYDTPTGDAYMGFLIKLEKALIERAVLIQSDPILRSLNEGVKIRVKQMEQEKRLVVQEKKTELLEEKASLLSEKATVLEEKATVLEKKSQELSDALLDMPLNNTQFNCLKEYIDAKAQALGSLKTAGVIQRELKEHFGLNKTNSCWYHLPQRNYEAAVAWVGNWK